MNNKNEEMELFNRSLKAIEDENKRSKLICEVDYKTTEKAFSEGLRRL